MAGKPRFDREEVDIRLRPGRQGERRHPLVPWWMRLEQRFLNARRQQARPRKQHRGSKARAQLRSYQRRSVVKVMYTRNGKPKAGAWVAHARYLTRRVRSASTRRGGVRRGA